MQQGKLRYAQTLKHGSEDQPLSPSNSGSTILISRFALVQIFAFGEQNRRLVMLPTQEASSSLYWARTLTNEFCFWLNLFARGPPSDKLFERKNTLPYLEQSQVRTMSHISCKLWSMIHLDFRHRHEIWRHQCWRLRANEYFQSLALGLCLAYIFCRCLRTFRAI